MKIRSSWKLYPIRAVLGLASGFLLALGTPAMASLSHDGGTGILTIQSAESKRAATLELGFFAQYELLEFGDSLDNRLNSLRGGANAAIGLSNGFEISASLPIIANYLTQGSGETPFDQNPSLRLGDLTGRVRWTGPLGPPGLRWGVEGEATVATGDDKVVTYPGRMPTRPYTIDKTSWTGRGLVTWDGVRAGAAIPLRLHGNISYFLLQDESRYLIPATPLALELPAPGRDRDNNVLSYGGAFELDFPRLTVFGEIVTHQLTNRRDLLRGKENFTAVTPGVRFWFPGGISLTGAYSFQIAEDDPSTSFNPDHAFPGNQARVALSLGSVYRKRSEAPPPMTTMPPVGSAASSSVVPPPPTLAAPDTTQMSAKNRAFLDRREVQESTVEPAPPAPTTGPQLVVPQGPADVRTVRPAPGSAFVDTDGDGIADFQDLCPLAAEDWDGFQDFDGCPDLDNDQDGIPDVRDACPNEPETFNGYKDYDGCPDELPKSYSSRGDTLSTAKVMVVAPTSEPSLTKSPTPAASKPMRVAQPTERPAPAVTGPAVGSAAETVPPAAMSLEQLELRRQLETERSRRIETEYQLRLAQQALLQSERGVTNNPPASRGAQTIVVPSPSTTVSTPPATSPGDERMRALEEELRGLRLRMAELSDPSSANDEEIRLRREATAADVRRLMGQMDSLLVMNNQAQAAGPAAETRASQQALDLALPLGRARVFPEIQFASGNARVRPEAAPLLDEIAAMVKSVPSSHLTIVGHTDNVGSARANLRLSEERADAIVAALVARSVAHAQLTAVGRGEAEPLADNGTAEGRERNRRVEFIRDR